METFEKEHQQMADELKIAYIVSGYKYPKQLIRLVGRLNTKGTYFLIHIDKKTSDRVYQEVVVGLSSLKNVYFLKRHNCYWGDFGHVRASIKGLEELFKQNISFDYVKVLTGQDYPIKSNHQIKEFLSKNCQNSFIRCLALPISAWNNGGLTRIEKVHLRPFGRHFTLPWIRRKLPQKIKVFGGSSYWFFPFEVARYVNQFIEQNAWYVDYFKYVEIPDELFFQTIIMNSPFHDRVINNNLTYALWIPSSPHPEVFTSSHFDQLSNSECLFARKFDETKDSEILDLIDSHLL